MVTPRGSALVFSWTGGSPSGSPISIAIDDISVDRETLEFDRMEFSNERQRAAKTTAGGLTSISPSWSNQPIQTTTTCSGDVARPLGTDDGNINNIKKKFVITKYEIKASPNLSSVIAPLAVFHKSDIQKLAKFRLHLAKGAQMDLSITALQALQAENFSYLTSSNLTMTGTSIDGDVVSNVLITGLRVTTEYDVTERGNANPTILKAFNMTAVVYQLTDQETIIS